jgi:hypothetical protein
MANLEIEIGIVLPQWQKKLNEAETKLRSFGKQATALGSILTKGVSLPIAAIGTAAFAASVKVGNFADQLLDLEQQTGLSTDALQKYRSVTTAAGIATDAVARASENLQRRLASGEEGSKDLTDGLKALGVSARDSAGNLRSIDNILEESISKLSDYSDITERNQLALKIFGRSASELAPLLALGSKGIEDAKNRAVELGLVLSKEALEGANQFRIQIDTLKDSLGGIGNEIGIAFLPVARKLVDLLQNNVVPVVRNIISFFQNLSDTTKTIITVIAGLAAGIGPLLVALGGVLQILPLLSVGFAALTGPIGLIVAAVAGAATLIIINFDEIKRNLQLLSLEFISTAIDIVKGIDLISGAIPGFKATTTAVIFGLEALGQKVAKSIVEGLSTDGVNGVEDFEKSLVKLNTTTKVSFEQFSALADLRNKAVFAKWDEEAEAYNRTLQETISLQQRLEAFAQSAISEFSGPNIQDLGIELTLPITEFADELDAVTERAKFNVSELANVFGSLGTIIGSAFGGAGSRLGQFAAQFAKFAAEVVIQAFAVSKANAIAGATAAGAATGPAAPFVTPALIASGLAVIATAFSGIKGGLGGGGGRGGFGSGGGQGQSISGSSTSGLFESNRNISLALEPVITGDQIRFVLDRSNERRN